MGVALRDFSILRQHLMLMDKNKIEIHSVSKSPKLSHMKF